KVLTKMKFICNDLYRHLIDRAYDDKILYLSNEECDTCAEGYDLTEVEGMIAQPFYVNKAFLDRMPNLKWVQITGAGYDRVDVEEVKKRDLILTNTRGVMSISIAEDIFSKILFFSRRIRTVEEDKKNSHWGTFDQDQWMCTCYDDLYGKTIGIMGFGSIGYEIGKRAKAFEMKVQVYDIVPIEHDVVDECFVGADRLDDFYGSCDYIVLSLPLNQYTIHMLNEKAFATMKDSAIFLNVARGPIVDTAALVDALKKGVIRGAALDVFEQEPLPVDSELWQGVPNLFISAHKAGMGDSWKVFIGDLIVRNIDHYNNGEEVENIIRL
ncbi:MAG: D-2-hydroxyacid dehydrogenase, partial [Eubacteriales bacterium]